MRTVSGVLGRGGCGIVDHFGLHGKVDVEIAPYPRPSAWWRAGGRQRTGGGMAAPKAAAPSSSLRRDDAKAAACLAALDILEESTELVDRLWENARYFKEEMRRLGFDTGNSTTPITPVMLEALAQQFSRELFENGVFAMAIGFPTVPLAKPASG